MNQNFEVISTGRYRYTDKNIFELEENYKKNEKNYKQYFWKISLSSEVVDIKSKSYDYKGYKRFEFSQAS